MCKVMFASVKLDLPLLNRCLRFPLSYFGPRTKLFLAADLDYDSFLSSDLISC